MIDNSTGADVAFEASGDLLFLVVVGAQHCIADAVVLRDWHFAD